MSVCVCLLGGGGGGGGGRGESVNPIKFFFFTKKRQIDNLPE